MSKGPRIRIEAKGDASQQTRVFIADDEGNETEIPRVTAATIRLDVSHINRAVLEVACVNGEFNAFLDGVIVKHFWAQRFPKVRRLLWRVWRPKHSYFGNTTSLGDKWSSQVATRKSDAIAVHVDAQTIDISALTERVRAQLLRNQRRSGTTGIR